jgi:MFS family permease
MWAPGPIFGSLVDTFGPAPVLYPCAILCTLSLALTSLAHKYYQIFLAQGLGFGIGAGGIFTRIATAGSSIGNFIFFLFNRQDLTNCLGGVIFPIFFDKVMHRVGFYGAIRYTALMIGILMAFSCILITSRLPRKKWDSKLKWFDLTLFKEKRFALFTIGAFFAM